MKNGARILLDLLKEKGVDVCFGYPGGFILPFYDELYHTDLRHILVRHEQGAVHMADGYARISGRPGIVFVTSGPGATNTVTGITNAKMDSVPLIVITGQVNTTAIGTDAFQEADIFGITIPITKYNALIKDVNELASIFEEAWSMATCCRPGPVLLDFPRDIQIAELEKVEARPRLSPRLTTRPPIGGDLKGLAAALNQAERPLLMVGGGAVITRADCEVRALAEKAQSPVAFTLLGLGAFPGKHPLALGMAGMHGTAYANKAILECDFYLSLGARFDDRVAGNPDDFAPEAIKGHVDIDTGEFHKRVRVDFPIHGELKDVLTALLPLVESKDRSGWLQHLDGYKKNMPLTFEDSVEKIKPQRLIHELYEKTNGGAIIATDVGQHQMWTAQYYHFDRPNRFVSSGGLGTMGFGLPASIGAQIAAPDDLVICISGDGSIQMCIQELATIRQYDLPVKIVILNNNFLGMVRQWQELFFEKRFAESEWQFNPDFVRLAESYGIPGKRITVPADIDAGLDFLLEKREPALLEVLIPPEEKVMPMIAAGKSQRDMMQFGDLPDQS